MFTCEGKDSSILKWNVAKVTPKRRSVFSLIFMVKVDIKISETIWSFMCTKVRMMGLCPKTKACHF